MTPPDERHSAPILRIARPTNRLHEVAAMYREGLALEVLGEFEAHDGFDGVMLGHPRAPWHLEFTSREHHDAGRAPTEDNLLIFYLPELAQWEEGCARMREAGFVEVPAFNPYWDRSGRTFEDPDGYRVVLSQRAWDR